MNDLTIVVLLWCAGNTIAIVAAIAMLVSVRREFASRTHQLDIRDQLHNVTERLDRDRIHRDRDLRNAVEMLIQRIEADPLTAERHFLNLTALKEKLR